MKLAEKSFECVSCGENFTGRFCSNCGEKKVDEKERTILHFFGQLLNAITFSDSKMIRSLGLLLIKPGFLSREYIDGRRNIYTKPLPLFLIINLLYFLVQPVDTFYTGFVSQTEYQTYSDYTGQMASAKMEVLGISKSDLAKKYDRVAVDYSKTLIILIVFLFSIPLSLVFLGKRQYYYNHIIFSLGYISFILLGPMLILSILLYGVKYFFEGVLGISFQLNINSIGFSSFLASILLFYLIFGLKRFYKQKYRLIIPKAFFLVLCTLGVVIGYRFLMFIIIIQSL